MLAAVPFTSVLRGTQLVMLLPEPMPSGTNDPFLALWAAQTGDATITIGLSEVALPEHAPDALRQAQYAAELGTRIGRIGTTIRYQDLGIFRLLHQVGRPHHDQPGRLQSGDELLSIAAQGRDRRQTRGFQIGGLHAPTAWKMTLGSVGRSARAQL